MSLLDGDTVLDTEDTRPSYYGGPDNPYEPVKVIDDLGLGPGFYYGSALKYLQRAGKKGDEEMKDLHKAQWYLSNGVELGYEVPKFGDMKPFEVIRGWDIPEGLLWDVVYLILRNEPAAAALALEPYITWVTDSREPKGEADGEAAAEVHSDA